MQGIDKVIFEQAIQEYGDEAQIFMAIEEMGELIQAISKNKRGRDNIDNLAEEITDVRIMLDQLEMIFNVEDLCSEYRTLKIRKLYNRVRKEGVDNA